MLPYRRLFKYRMGRYSGSYDISPKYRLIIRYIEVSRYHQVSISNVHKHRDTSIYRVTYRTSTKPDPASPSSLDSFDGVDVLLQSRAPDRVSVLQDWPHSRLEEKREDLFIDEFERSSYHPHHLVGFLHSVVGVCSLKVNRLSMVTPRSFSAVVFLSSVVWPSLVFIVYVCSRCRCPILMILHLSGWNFSIHFCEHASSLLMSYDRRRRMSLLGIA